MTNQSLVNNIIQKYRSVSTVLVFVIIIAFVLFMNTDVGRTIPKPFKPPLAELSLRSNGSAKMLQNLSSNFQSDGYDSHRYSKNDETSRFPLKNFPSAFNYSSTLFRSSSSPPILWLDAYGDTHWNEAAEREMYILLLDKQTIDAMSDDQIVDQCLNRHLFVIDQHHWGFFSRHHCFIEQFGQTLYSPWMTLLSHRRFRVSDAGRDDFLSEGVVRYFQPISTCSKLARHPRMQSIRKRLLGDNTASMTVRKIDDLLKKAENTTYTFLDTDHVWSFGYEHAPHRRSLFDFNRLPLVYSSSVSYLTNHTSEHIYRDPSLSPDFLRNWSPRNRAYQGSSVHLLDPSYQLTWQDRVFTSFLRYIFVLYFHRMPPRISQLTTLLTEHWSAYMLDKGNQSLSNMGALFIRRGDKMPEDSFWQRHGRWRNVSMYVKGLVDEEQRQNRLFSSVFVMTDDVPAMQSIQDYANPDSKGTDEPYARKHLRGRQILYNVFAPQACFDPFIRVGFDQFLVTMEFIVQHAQFVVGHSDSNVGRYFEEVTYVRHQLNSSIRSDSFVKNAPDSL